MAFHFRKTIKYVFGVLSLLNLAAFSSAVLAADIRPYISGSGSYREVIIEGVIEPGDYETFLKIMRENQAQISGARIYSPGGDFQEAMQIGRAVHALELASSAPMRDSSGHPNCDNGGFEGAKPSDPKNCTCASAGFFIHIGGVHRGGTYLAVHRPYYTKGKFGTLSQADAKKAFDALQDSAREYMQEMKVPKHIQEDVLGTSSDKAMLLDEKAIKTYFWGDLPYRHEWMKNRCSKLSDLETEKLDNYSQRLLMARKSSDVSLSQTEREDLKGLQEKQSEELSCAVALDKQSRIDAYEKFFRSKPSDSASQNFSKWSEAAKYLGRRFYEITAEERFDEEASFGRTSLKRPATAGAPSIRLGDSNEKSKVVTSVSLIGTSNPSPEYVQKVITSLSGAWGKRSGGNGTTDWMWIKKEFSAKLELFPTSASGPFLALVIDGK